MAVILVTHDLGVIADRADKVAVMYAGRVVETTDTVTLFANPRHPYTEALFEALPEKAAGQHGPEGSGSAIRRLYNIPGQPPDLARPPAACTFAPRCRYAQDTCRSSEPALTDRDDGHFYRCYFPVDTDPAATGNGKSPGAKAKAERTTPRAAAAAAPAAADGDGAATLVAANGNALLRLDKLVKNHPVTSGAVLQRKAGEISAVADVSFAVPPGSTFGLVGESGCGKTTIGRLIVGLEKATSGGIIFEGDDLAGLSDRKRRRHGGKVQLMFQDSYAAMDPRMRVGTILREPLAIQHQGSRTDHQRRILAILDEVGLPAKAADRYPHEFSGGQRQRLGLARALILRPDMIVADEPVSALDVSIQAQILNLMRDLQREHELTYLFISHDLQVVRCLRPDAGSAPAARVPRICVPSRNRRCARSPRLASRPPATSRSGSPRPASRRRTAQPGLRTLEDHYR
jgi:oligopeptide/dipeptide ABC transporter ATP-binding protein